MSVISNPSFGGLWKRAEGNLHGYERPDKKELWQQAQAIMVLCLEEQNREGEPAILVKDPSSTQQWWTNNPKVRTKEKALTCLNLQWKEDNWKRMTYDWTVQLSIRTVIEGVYKILSSLSFAQKCFHMFVSDVVLPKGTEKKIPEQ